MKQPHALALVSLLTILGGCATQPETTIRHGRILTADTPPAAPAKAALPARPVVAPAAPAPASAPRPIAAPAPAKAPSPNPAPAPAQLPAIAAFTPAPAALPVVTAAPLAAPRPVAGSPLAATRAGSAVKLAWLLPSSDVAYKSVEVMRNNRAGAPGRTRVRAVRATVTELQDTVPDAGADYWYWLKLTREDGQVRNIGPVAVPATRSQPR